MTKYPFLLNGVDFSHLIHFRSYQTDRQPVFSNTYTDLDGVDHYVVSRWRGFANMSTNDMKVEDAAALSAELMKWPLRVTYYSFQLEKVVTETMTFTKFPLPHKLSTSRADWVGAVALNFAEV